MSKTLVHDFAKAISSQNVAAIYRLMTSDHTFIDALGNEISSAEVMKTGWAGYFEMFPDYHIELVDVFENGNMFAAFGFAGGTYKGIKGKSWRLPAAWKVIVENNKIKLWQVYADTKMPFELMHS
ncbi:MAG TPA: nuclear transport factor 2 family protein [Flavobacteriales bacterium]|nr:nuclear transport factor 2 family protein [Flavobacteriales bacterium]